MTEFLELVKGAPNFNVMERSELVIHAYAMFAAGAKADAENAKLRELLSSYWKRTHSPASPNVERDYLLELRELGIEVNT